MAKKKKQWIRNDVVYDPNIEFPTPFDDNYEEVGLLKKQYRSGKGKRQLWKGP